MKIVADTGTDTSIRQRMMRVASYQQTERETLEQFPSELSERNKAEDSFSSH